MSKTTLAWSTIRRLAGLWAAAIMAVSCGGTDDGGRLGEIDPNRMLGANKDDPAVTVPDDAPSLYVIGPYQPAIRQSRTVNVVTIGFDGLIDEDEFASQLAPYSITPLMYGSYMWWLYPALRTDFAYNVIHAPSWFEDALFAYLKALAVPQPPMEPAPGVPAMPISPGQYFYNYCNIPPSAGLGEDCSLDPSAPRVNSRMVTQNHLIDAGQVEKTLAWALGAYFGLDVSAPTVVLINWYGRPDYVDHVYVSVDEPDPETGWVRGLDSRNLLAGTGGTPADDPESCAAGDCMHHRLWFHDLSAGPFLRRTYNWDLVGNDARGTTFPNGVMDYRIHHTADYLAASSETYRPIDSLTEDLATRLVSDIFLNEIAYVFPIYPTDVSGPNLPGHIEMDVNRFAWDPATPDLSPLLDAPRLATKMSKLAPYDVSVELTERRETRDGRLGQVWDCWTGAFDGDDSSCFGERLEGYGYADMVLYMEDHVFQFLEGDADYEIGSFVFSTSDEDAHPSLMGIAEGSYSYPREIQSFVFAAMSTSNGSLSGQGHVLAHEAGHHLGLSHPFHGVRCLNDDCSSYKMFWANDDTFYTWHGDHVQGLMNYKNLNNDYGRFERDNVARWGFYNHLWYSNLILHTIYSEKPHKVGDVAALLQQADAMAYEALVFFFVYNDYEAAARRMRDAFKVMVTAINTVGLPFESYASQADWRKTMPSHLGLKEYIKENWVPEAVVDSPEEFGPSGPLQVEGLTGDAPVFTETQIDPVELPSNVTFPAPSGTP